ncbi:MAG: TolC family protein [Prevotellaceae bacterium]|jgi:outer membrane protein TolC|nr:TolC family protein [Prevotellaceae bacterium]
MKYLYNYLLLRAHFSLSFVQRFTVGSLLFLSGIRMLGAQERLLTLNDAFVLAEKQSLDASIARNVFLNAVWHYRNYRATLLPNVVLDGSLPTLNRSLNTYQKEDGSYGFVENNILTENLSLSVQQNIPFTGGVFAVQSQLQRMDQLNNKTTSYLSVPFTVTLQQPLFHAKTLKWAMRIEPERYREAMKQYQVDMENVYLHVINYYFDLLLAKVNLDISGINFDNAVKLADIAKGKKNLGLISQNEVYQLELNKVNAESAVISALQAYESRMLTLRNYLRMEGDGVFLPVIPEGFTHLDITTEQVVALSHKNHPVTHSLNRRIMEAQRQIDQAKANRGFNADLYVSIGSTGSDLTLPDSYRHLQNRQMVSMGIRIPILDWGRGKGGVKLAESEREVVTRQAEQTQLNFEQNIVLSVSQFRNQAKQVNLSYHADSIARLRYETAFQTFVMGTINVLDINSAQMERDNARRKYINELYLSWLNYYNLRQITLFDFVSNTDVMHPAD